MFFSLFSLPGFRRSSIDPSLPLPLSFANPPLLPRLASVLSDDEDFKSESESDGGSASSSSDSDVEMDAPAPKKKKAVAKKPDAGESGGEEPKKKKAKKEEDSD